MKLKVILTTAIVGMALGLPSGAGAAPFVYAVNPYANDVSQYDASIGGLAPCRQRRWERAVARSEWQ